MTRNHSRPAPLETDPGEQNDDNIDDLGRRPDGGEQDQPTTPDDADTHDDPSGDKSRPGTS